MRAAGKERQQKENTIWDMLGTHCSANERRADEASRDVEAWPVLLQGRIAWAKSILARSLASRSSVCSCS